MNSTTKAIMYVKLKAGADGGLDKTRAPHIHQADSGYIVLGDACGRDQIELDTSQL